MIRLFLGNYLYPLGNFGTARKKLKVWELITPRLSALGHKRTSDDRSGISALPPRADLFSIGANVRYVPEAATSPHAAALPQRKPVRAERGQITYCCFCCCSSIFCLIISLRVPRIRSG